MEIVLIGVDSVIVTAIYYFYRQTLKKLINVQVISKRLRLKEFKGLLDETK